MEQLRQELPMACTAGQNAHYEDFCPFEMKQKEGLHKNWRTAKGQMEAMMSKEGRGNESVEQPSYWCLLKELTERSNIDIIFVLVYPDPTICGQ